ncbi:MAG: FHA domain-containing protein [Planctomycetota bacterium]|nr:MAG: FHA domain-containing protein [Planctomycetota bacterium]
MDVRLVVKKGDATKKSVRLKTEETIVGRRQDCDLRIRSAEISRRHCLLSYHDGVLHVEDLDSVNGTYVNGTRVAGRQIVRPGDILEIGPLRFVAEYQLSRAALKRLGQDAAPAAAADEELDVLPVAEADEQNAFDFNESEELDALPFNEPDTELATPSETGEEEPAEALAAEEDEESIPVAEELEGDWRLPQDNDLRDLLSKMDDSKPKNQPKTH